MQINFRIYDGIGLHFFVLYQTFKEEFSMKKQEVKIVKRQLYSAVQSWIRV